MTTFLSAFPQIMLLHSSFVAMTFVIFPPLPPICLLKPCVYVSFTTVLPGQAIFGRRTVDQIKFIKF